MNYTDVCHAVAWSISTEVSNTMNPTKQHCHHLTPFTKVWGDIAVRVSFAIRHPTRDGIADEVNEHD